MYLFKRIFLFAVQVILFFPFLLGDQALLLAEKFYLSGNYFQAVTEYKRFLFFNADIEGDLLSDIYFKIGMSYCRQNIWDKGKEALENAIYCANSEKKKDEMRINLAIAMIASGSYSEAEFLLLKVEMFSSDVELKKRASFFRGISSIYSYKWKEAREAFAIYFDNSIGREKDVYKEIDTILLKAASIKYKSKKIAKTLSAILPGAGQIYAGDYRNGINAIILNILIGYFLASELLEKKIKDFIFDFSYLYRFYKGNISGAERSTERYNQCINKEMAKKLLKIMQDKFQ